MSLDPTKNPTFSDPFDVLDDVQLEEALPGLNHSVGAHDSVVEAKSSIECGVEPMGEIASESSMELAIGSDFECTTRMSQENLAEMDMDARAVFGSAVVHLMQGIQGASLKIIKGVRSRTKLSVRVKAISERHARLWAVLDMQGLSDGERQQMRDFAASVTSEMYEPTDLKRIADFRSRLAGIQSTDLSSKHTYPDSKEGKEAAMNAQRIAIAEAAEETLTPHLQKVLAAGGPKLTANVAVETIRRVVEGAGAMSEEMSKSKEWRGLELRFGQEALIQRDELPKAREEKSIIDELAVQDAFVTKMNFVKFSMSLHLLADDLKVDVMYNDAEYGNAIGESLVAAHRANQHQSKESGGGVKLPQMRVGVTRDTTGRTKTYTLRSLENR